MYFISVLGQDKGIPLCLKELPCAKPEGLLKVRGNQPPGGGGQPISDFSDQEGRGVSSFLRGRGGV